MDKEKKWAKGDRAGSFIELTYQGKTNGVKRKVKKSSQGLVEYNLESKNGKTGNFLKETR